MAQPTNTFDTYDQVGIREDLTDFIYDISPTETPFYSSCAKTTATNTYHEWQTESLRASADNKHIQGDASTASARTPTVRLGNYSQIFKDTVIVSGTDSSVSKAGRGNDMDHQTAKIAKEQKLDIEKALLANNARVAGSSSTAPELAGIGAWIATNSEMATAGSPADPTGDGTDARTDGTALALTQTRLDDAMEKAWVSGGMPTMCLLPSSQMKVALTFTGNNNQRATIDASKTKVVNVIDVYMTPWGTIEFTLSREMRSSDVLILQADMWKVPVLRGTFSEKLAKDGDYDKKHVITELTLESCNEAASAIVADNS